MRNYLAVMFCIVLLLGVGCDTKSGSARNTRAVAPRLEDADTAVLQQDDLTIGIDFLHRTHGAASYENSEVALYHLNQWLAREARQSHEWKRAALVQYIPKSLAEIPPMQELERLRLTRDDLEFLHGRIWQREVGNWVTKRTLDSTTAAWLAENRNGLNAEKRGDLQTALQLFDWTIRNIQLDAFPPAEEEKAVGTSASKESDALPPQRGIPGPGYQRYPYQTMLFGHGDAYERSRVFIELCRQRQIDSVTLAIDSENGPARPWAVAVLVGAELYLFDAEMGLPLPAHQHRGVATLAQLAKEPELLEQLNVSEKRPYWVKHTDLASLRVFISAAPEELSQRMWLLDRKNPGNKHLVLFADVDAIAERVSRSPQLAGTKVSLWRVPFECWLYVSLGQGLRLTRNPELADQFNRETLVLRTPGSPLRQGRERQLEGYFVSPPQSHARGNDPNSFGINEDAGAIEIFLATRPEGKAVEDLAYSVQWQQALGLVGQMPQDPKVRKEQFDFFQALVRGMRHDSTYWLGLIQCEKEDYTNAITWLKASLPEDSDKKPWTTGAQYNLARCFEQLNQPAEAIKFYRKGDSPRRHGDLLRAKWLSEEKASTASP